MAELKRDKSGLNGIEKVAAFMLTLTENQLAKIFDRMDEEEIRQVSHAMSSLGKVPSALIENLLLEFTQDFLQKGNVVGSYDSTERLLAKILPKEKVSSIMEDIRGPAGRTMWDKLGNVNEEILANFLKNEHPQTVAVILSKIRAEHAARVLSVMQEDMALEVMLRMLKMESLQKEILEDVERTLRIEFMNNLSRSSRRDNHEMVAEIFNFFDRASETKFIHSLEEKSPESAERVKALMFTFDDLVKIDNMGIQTLLRLIDRSKLSLALKGATEVVKSLFFRNMSERAAKILKEEMESMGPVRVKDVDEAQAYIVLMAKEASNRGEITIHKDDEEDQLIT